MYIICHAWEEKNLPETKQSSLLISPQVPLSHLGSLRAGLELMPNLKPVLPVLTATGQLTARKTGLKTAPTSAYVRSCGRD